MCNAFDTPRKTAVEKLLKKKFPATAEKFYWDGHIKISLSCPVIHLENDEYVVSELPFVTPSNARLNSFADDNEDGKTPLEDRQISMIYEKRTFSTGMSDKPFVVPVKRFHESAYWGPKFGTVQAFSVPDQDLFFIAAIGIKPWTVKKDGFSLITGTATKQMLNYHHRLVAILLPEHVKGYLEKMSGEQRYKYLVNHRYTGPLQVEKVRELSESSLSKKNIRENKEKLEEEMEFSKKLKLEGIDG